MGTVIIDNCKCKKKEIRKWARISCNEYGTIYILYKSIHIYIYLHTAAAKIKTIETKRNTFKMQLKNQQRIGNFLQYLQYYFVQVQHTFKIS